MVDHSNTDLESEGSNPVSHILAGGEHGRERGWPKECLACSQIGFKKNFILLFCKYLVLEVNGKFLKGEFEYTEHRYHSIV